MTDTMRKHIEDLIARAAAQHDSGDAMRFAQAALNAANAGLALMSMSPLKPAPPA